LYKNVITLAPGLITLYCGNFMFLSGLLLEQKVYFMDVNACLSLSEPIIRFISPLFLSLKAEFKIVKDVDVKIDQVFVHMRLFLNH